MDLVPDHNNADPSPYKFLAGFTKPEKYVDGSRKFLLTNI